MRFAALIADVLIAAIALAPRAWGWERHFDDDNDQVRSSNIQM